VRPGHHRPLGTTTTQRFTQWSGERLPELDDIAMQISAAGLDDADYIRRAYRVVGVIEGRDRQHFRLVMERVEYGTLPEPLDADKVWFFYNLPRGRI
jgi:hypothetical protein